MSGSSGAPVGFLMYPQAENANGRYDALDPLGPGILLQLPKGAWWQIFHDEELNGYEQQLLAANQSLAAARNRLDQARSPARNDDVDILTQLQHALDLGPPEDVSRPLPPPRAAYVDAVSSTLVARSAALAWASRRRLSRRSRRRRREPRMASGDDARRR